MKHFLLNTKTVFISFIFISAGCNSPSPGNYSELSEAKQEPSQAKHKPSEAKNNEAPPISQSTVTHQAPPELTPKEKFLTRISHMKYDASEIKEKERTIHFADGFYTIDENGDLLYVDSTNHITTHLEFHYNPASSSPNKADQFEIIDSHSGAHFRGPRLSSQNVDDLIVVQRSVRTFLLKTKNHECYETIAKQRLHDSSPYERLEAMERPINPRPLLFHSDSQYNEFKQELGSILRRIGHGHFVIIGTSTTFFSQNPSKGQNSAYSTEPGSCNMGPNVYTFDNPGSEPSDLDVHLFIPELSELCHLANVKGNNGDREVYWENHIDRCMAHSSDVHTKALVRDPSEPIHVQVDSKVYSIMSELMKVPQQVFGNQNKLLHTLDGDFKAFIHRWDIELDHRPINFSARILPTYKKGLKSAKGIRDFNNDPALKSRFAVEIN